MDYNLTLFTVFGAGLVSFLSPCVVPMLPTYTALLAGSGTKGDKGQWIFLINAISFLSGYTLIFVAMGATASYVGELFINHQETIRKVGAVFMVIMGMQVLGIVKLPGLEREHRPLLNKVFTGPAGAFLLGLAFTAGWTPCTGPILATVLVYAGGAATASQGAFLLLIYSMGFCVPFLAFALLLRRYITRIERLYRWLPVIQQVSGAILIIVGLIIYFDLMHKVLGLL